MSSSRCYTFLYLVIFTAFFSNGLVAKEIVASPSSEEEFSEVLSMPDTALVRPEVEDEKDVASASSRITESPINASKRDSSDSSLYEAPLFLEMEQPGFSVSEGAASEELPSLEEEGSEKSFSGLFEFVEEQASVPILTPSLAQRESLKMRLANGLEILLVSDLEAHKSGAALSVNVGSWSDPEEFPGMAHFVEHLLFLGTKEFPEESGFKGFMNENSGQSNAYTASDRTVYGFAISHDAFPEALHRFSTMFTHPLFSTSGISRELQVVDQEYAKNIEDDYMRMLMVRKELGNKYHPMTKFNIGSVQTLQKATQEDVRNWFEEKYSSNLMKLVITSALPIDSLKKMVVDHFSGMKNKDVSPLSPQTTITSPTYDGHMTYISPLKNMRRLTLQWELSSEFAFEWESKSMEIAAHVMGHEGKESLLALLKREQFAEGLSAGGNKIGDNNALFTVSIDLTEEGLKNVDSVIEHCFQAVMHFKESGIPPYLFDELQRMALIRYQHQSREEVFHSLFKHASALLYEDLETYPEKTKLYTTYNPRGIRRLFSELSPDHCHIILQADPEITGIKNDRKEKWLGAEYTVMPIPDRTLTSWSNVRAHPDLDLPSPNPFVPEALMVKNRPTVGSLVPHPITLVDEPTGKIFFAADTKYMLPEVSWHFRLQSPMAFGSSRQKVLADLLARSLNEQLNSMSYEAYLAGLYFSFNHTEKDFSLKIEGYSDKAKVLLEEVLKGVREVKPSKEEFAIYRDSLEKSYQNFEKESPLKQSNELMTEIIFENFSSHKQKALEVGSITYEEFITFAEQAVETLFVEGLLYGNLTTADAREVWNLFTTTIQAKPFPKEKHFKERVLSLPQSVGPFYVVDKTDRQGNAVLLMLQQGEFSFKRRALQQILSQGLEQPFFSTLRTRQQTGYVVWNWDRELERQLYSFFAVQSNTHNVRDLLARFELFLETFVQEFTTTEFPEERFETIKKALVAELRLPRKNLQEMGELLSTLAFDYDGDFDWIAKRIQGFEELSYLTFVKEAKAFLGRENKQRLAILLKGTLPEENAFFYYRVNTPKKMRSISSYFSRD